MHLWTKETMAKIFPYLRTARQENKTSISTGQKKNLRLADACTKYNGRAPGLRPDYFCHEIVFAIFKDLDNHSAERHKLDWTNFHTIVGAKLVFCSYPSSIYDKYFPLFCELRKIVKLETMTRESHGRYYNLKIVAG